MGTPDDSSYSLPLESAVKPNAQPTAVADVGGSEEDLGLRFDQRLLRQRWRGAPQSEPPVAVMVVP